MVSAQGRPGQSARTWLKRLARFQKQKELEKKALFLGQRTGHSAKQRKVKSECPDLRAEFPPSIVPTLYWEVFRHLASVGLPAKTLHCIFP